MVEFREINASFRGFTRTLRAAVNFERVESAYSELRPAIHNLLNTSPALRTRVILCLHIIFSKIFTDELSETQVSQTYYFCSNAMRNLSAAQIYPMLDGGVRKITNSVENFIKNGSGWVLSAIDYVDVHIGNFVDYQGGCKLSVLPKSLENKRASQSFDCQDNKCFVYSVLAKLFPQQSNVRRSSLYRKHLGSLDTNMLKYPVEISDIKAFEIANKANINVFSYDEGMVFLFTTATKIFMKLISFFMISIFILFEILTFS